MTCKYKYLKMEEAYKMDEVGVNFYELGIEKPKSDKNHALIQSRILSRLDRFYGGTFTILADIQLNLSKNKTVPDLAVYAPLLFDSDDNADEMTNAPLCVIDILFSEQNLHGLELKYKNYFAEGVKSYWFVLPSLRTIYVFYGVENSVVFTHKDRLVDKILNIELDLSEIFR